MVIAGLLIYLRIDLELNKRAFQQANHAIDTIYANIVKEIGPPDDSRSENRCGKGQGLLSDGPWRCYINLFFVYGVANKEQSDQNINRIRSIITASQSGLKPTAPTPITKAAGNTSVTDYYQADKKISCEAIYEFDTEFGGFLNLNNPSDKRLTIAISCSGVARANYFKI